MVALTGQELCVSTAPWDRKLHDTAAIALRNPCWLQIASSQIDCSCIRKHCHQVAWCPALLLLGDNGTSGSTAAFDAGSAIEETGTVARRCSEILLYTFTSG